MREQDLLHLIQNHPVIDNHAHNILDVSSAENYEQFPFESLTSEARGAALNGFVKETLAHRRAVNQLVDIFNCDADWDTIKDARVNVIKGSYENLVKRCLEGTHMLLMDDGLGCEQNVHPLKWHDRFTQSSTRRLVRIESAAARVALSLVSDIQKSLEVEDIKNGVYSNECLKKYTAGFKREFATAIKKALEEDLVVGFKSIICYRTGLKDIESHSDEQLSRGILTHLTDVLNNKPNIICKKAVNDFLVIRTLEVLHEAGANKPIQFHTGLGDNDLSLVLANPAHLQPLIEKYAGISFVLLHSSYPYIREAGYLVSSYKNAYMDVGEVFPTVSREGQLSMLRATLELAPTSKILWSTDGHFHPETFWLANKQFREGLYTVLLECIRKDDLTPLDAMEIAEDIMFNNANTLYDLQETAEYTPLVPPIPEELQEPAHDDVLARFLGKHPHVEFVWCLFVDYTATIRTRMFPIREFRRLALGGRRLGITLALLNMLQNEGLVNPDPSPAGQFYLLPDLNTLAVNTGIKSNSASVMTFWETEKGEVQDGCPRSVLQDIAKQCEEDFNLKLLCGFEVEVVFMEKVQTNDSEAVYKPWLKAHSWSNVTLDTRRALPLLEEIVRELGNMGINVEQFHTESSPSQFEFILPPESPLKAVDILITTRQTIVHIAEKHGLRATLYPCPTQKAASTGAHVHVSINPPTRENAFLAGLLKHYTAILPFTLPQEVSYQRVKRSIWAGGLWVAWGNQNRETPIRRIEAGHWEIKSVDGLANPYLAVAAILAAGHLGMKKRLRLLIDECHVDPDFLPGGTRNGMGIRTPLPTTLGKALECLEANQEFCNHLGPMWIEKYMGVRRGEVDFLNTMDPETRKTWLIERY